MKKRFVKCGESREGFRGSRGRVSQVEKSGTASAWVRRIFRGFPVLTDKGSGVYGKQTVAPALTGKIPAKICPSEQSIDKHSHPCYTI